MECCEKSASFFIKRTRTDKWNVVRKALVSLLRGQERIGGML